jgi:3-hydroxyacyl-CoA dehydrogenase
MRATISPSAAGSASSQRSGEVEATARVPLLRRAAVVGAGTMGSRIAAHLANAGVPVVLLDIVPADGGISPGARSGLAAKAVEALVKSKPAAFYENSSAQLITPGNLEDDLGLLHGCDWVIEAVSENLAIKQALLKKIAPQLRPDAIVTTNTSGLPVASIAAEMPAEFRRRWFGTHFFNPPRYMRLVEIIATPDAEAEAVSAIAAFADRRLGKSVVYARDTPNFIANRIGTFAMLNGVRLMQEQGLTIEDVDSLTGSAIGWPRTGTFRLADMVGIDVLASVARNFSRLRSEDAASVQLPAFIEKMLENGWLGDKSGQGFYKKASKESSIQGGKDEQGRDLREALDWKTSEYRPAGRPKFPSLEMAKNAESLPERLRMLLDGDPRKDKAAAFYWPMLTELWNYAASCLPEIADDLASIDRAMRAGFNWELGPFEMWDAVGVKRTVEGSQSAVPDAVKRLLDSGYASWYVEDAGVSSGRRCFHPASGAMEPVVQAKGTATVTSYRRANGVVRQRPGASLIDIGDGIACIELHSKKDAIGDDIVRLITQTLKPDSDAVRGFQGFVISGDATNFSVGANLMQLLLAAQEGEWDEVDAAIRAFQGMTAAIKFSPRPVVVAPYGMCLGGGTEVCLHAARRQPHAELYMGLVETGVGLVPGGGGTKEMALRAMDDAAQASGISPAAAPVKFAQSKELLAAMKRNFETIALAKVSTSAADARSLGLLSIEDGITFNRERVLTDAKHVAMALAEEGYSTPLPRAQIAVPGEAVLATLKLGVHIMRQGDYISEHDAKIGNHVANILCGGSVTAGSLVSEQYLLDLERQAFLSLCGERKTLERIAFTLKTGKPLRN